MRDGSQSSAPVAASAVIATAVAGAGGTQGAGGRERQPAATVGRENFGRDRGGAEGDGLDKKGRHGQGGAGIGEMRRWVEDGPTDAGLGKTPDTNVCPRTW